jgi:hypothetical protein
MTNDREVPDYVVEVQRYQRHLASTLRIAEEGMNNLLREQIALLERRKELLCDLHRSVLDQWNEEGNRTPEIAVPLTASEKTPSED